MANQTLDQSLRFVQVQADTVCPDSKLDCRDIIEVHHGDWLQNVLKKTPKCDKAINPNQASTNLLAEYKIFQQAVLQAQQKYQELQNQLAQYQAIQQGLPQQTPRKLPQQIPEKLPQQISERLPQQSSKQLPVLNQIEGNRGSIVVDGSDEFKSKINGALELLTGEDLELVEKHTKRITEAQRTGALYWNQATEIGSEKIANSTEKDKHLAGVLVHEAAHNSLGTSYRSNSQEEELLCIRRQIDALKRMGGDWSEIQQLEAEDGKHYLGEYNW